MNKETQKRMAERLGQLLAESPLDDATKEGIIERLDQMTEGELFELHDMLKKEREQVANVAAWLQMLNQDQEEAWEEVEKKQKAVADDLLKKHIRQAKDEKKLKELKLLI